MKETLKRDIELEMQRHETKMEQLMNQAASNALSDAFNTIMWRCEKIEKVLNSETGQQIRNSCYGEKFTKLNRIWHELWKKSYHFMLAAEILIKERQEYFK